MKNGEGLGTGKGLGKGGGKGRNKGGAFGLGGYCVCAHCGYRTAHQQGIKCTGLKCPECGKPLIRRAMLEQKRNSE